jgi:hypothetical protein
VKGRAAIACATLLVGLFACSGSGVRVSKPRPIGTTITSADRIETIS